MKYNVCMFVAMKKTTYISYSSCTEPKTTKCIMGTFCTDEQANRPKALQANNPIAVCSLSGLAAWTTSNCWNRVTRFSMTDGNSFSHSLLREKLDHREPSSKFRTWYSLGKLFYNKPVTYLKTFMLVCLQI